MAGKRPARRGHGGALTLNLFSSNTTLGWRIVRQVPVELAIEQLALKKWRDVWSESVDGKRELLGVQPLKLEQHQATHHVFPDSYRNSVTITLKEMRMNAGEFGWSPAAERAVEKVRVYLEFQSVEPGLKPISAEVSRENYFPRLDEPKHEE